MKKKRNKLPPSKISIYGLEVAKANNFISVLKSRRRIESVVYNIKRIKKSKERNGLILFSFYRI